MKKILFIMASATALFGCTEAEPDNVEIGDGDGELAAPQVTFSGITSSSFTASWDAVEGAEEYRYEVTWNTGSGKEIIAVEPDFTGTSFTLERLQPATEYSVRVAARSGDATSRNWFSGTVTTGGTELSLAITPVEKYFARGGYVYPAASVRSSDEDVYYWVSAVPSDNMDNALSWVREDIDNNISYYGGWDGLVESGLIMKGSGESVGFNFSGYGNFCFVAVPVSNTASGITVSSKVYESYPFFAAGIDVPMPFAAEKDDFVGEWMLTTSSTLMSENGYFVENAGEIFPVTISEAGTGLGLTGWGGDRNRYSSHQLALDYVQSGNYGEFTISLPQTITVDDDGTEWKYYSWFTFYDGATSHYMRFDPDDFDLGYPELVQALSEAFEGFMGNLNKTVVKIIGTQLTASDGSGLVVNGLWPYGIASDGEGVYLNGRHEEPFEIYFLVRKDVADGKVIELPESSTGGSTVSVSMPSVHAETVSADNLKVKDTYVRIAGK
ncbi:MAG: fibronectin type III domain-containing protein [Bacteroidetes bacterium]|uniref:Fibronectin type III domain-containing protein n=1 Tax=Candidatus Cryptobacteroides merdavium TaxID=2840769 RepID=A0A9D9HB70_9BACT|nr:fibronectin type III domain-containing protein [Candidatus Cryptobacteroides merdavium]